MFKKFNNKTDVCCSVSENIKRKKNLEGQLILFRSFYNFFKILTLNFTPVFLLSFVGTMMSFAESMNQGKHISVNDVNCVVDSLNSFFLYILLVQVALSVVVCIFYELMKHCKSELKRINKAQSRLKKVGIRYCGSNLTHYVNFVG